MWYWIIVKERNHKTYHDRDNDKYKHMQHSRYHDRPYKFFIFHDAPPCESDCRFTAVFLFYSSIPFSFVFISSIASSNDPYSPEQ